eukprot:CAMPEP_0198550602 /NCGR_PEP_ID=MMETSP1462-20131121/75152_1 /TAXON_ID=1333877 /ORGANISM="Brandtodinium nutriculum, Strain RCC3387" /LENGTH=56 /DNA_ID=CAMNT_0044281219 /DNA_START=36 /DNA_END=203 /DNA_ORIENTATION=-
MSLRAWLWSTKSFKYAGIANLALYSVHFKVLAWSSGKTDHAAAIKSVITFDATWSS